MVVHPGVGRCPLRVHRSGSSPAIPRHPRGPTYRCFLPDLAGFVGPRRAGPGSQHRLPRTEVTCTRVSSGEFSLAIADCEYRVPLTPHLARPHPSYYWLPLMVTSWNATCWRKMKTFILWYQHEHSTQLHETRPQGCYPCCRPRHSVSPSDSVRSQDSSPGT